MKNLKLNPAAESSSMAPMSHGNMPMNHANMNTAPDSAAKGAGMNMMNMDMGTKMDQSAMMKMHTRMMADPVIRERVMRDTTMRRLMNEMMQSMPANNKSGVTKSTRTKSTSSMAKTSSTAKGRTTPKAKTAAKKKLPVKPTAKPMPPMDHSANKMPGMEMPPAKKN